MALTGIGRELECQIEWKSLHAGTVVLWTEAESVMGDRGVAHGTVVRSGRVVSAGPKMTAVLLDRPGVVSQQVVFVETSELSCPE